LGRRQFSAEFKTKIVLEILREEKQIGELAARHGSVNPKIVELFTAQSNLGKSGF